MTAKYSSTYPTLKFDVADVRQLSELIDVSTEEKAERFPADTYDAVIDKACLDSILCADYSTPNGKLFCENVCRVLNDQGHFISVSYGVPAARMKQFIPSEPYLWGNEEKSVKVYRVAKLTEKRNDVISGGGKLDADDGKHFHYVYVMQKQGLSVPKAAEQSDE